MKINVLSLFDGMSCGQIALDELGIEVENYFASEIDKHAIKVTQNNYPNAVQLGSVLDFDSWELPKIHLLSAGSPCQDLSRFKTGGKGLEGEKSKLFYTFVDAVKKFKPDFFFLENVIMNKESEDEITKLLGVEPVKVNSEHFSAQDRPRIYWTNLPFSRELPGNKTVFADIAETNVDESFFINDGFAIYNGEESRVAGLLNNRYPNGKLKYNETIRRVYNQNFKAPCLTAVCGGHQEKKVMDNGRPRKVTPLEYERLQTVPDGYTDSVSKSQRYKMLGNGWNVETIKHFFKSLKEIYGGGEAPPEPQEEAEYKLFSYESKEVTIVPESGMKNFAQEIGATGKMNFDQILTFLNEKNITVHRVGKFGNHPILAKKVRKIIKRIVVRIKKDERRPTMKERLPEVLIHRVEQDFGFGIQDHKVLMKVETAEEALQKLERFLPVYGEEMTRREYDCTGEAFNDAAEVKQVAPGRFLVEVNIRFDV